MAEERRRAAEISHALATAGINAVKGVEHFDFVDDQGRQRSVARRTYRPHPLTPDLVNELQDAGFQIIGEPEVRPEGRTVITAPDDIESLQIWEKDACDHGLESCGSLGFMHANFKRRTTKKGKQ